MEVYHSSATGTVTTNPAWILTPTAQRVYDVLCYTLQVGERTHISHADIAAAGNLSESTVSRVIPEVVEHGFIDRERIEGGRGGGYYVITLLQLPPAHAVPGISDGWDQQRMGSPDDPSEKAIGMPESTDFAAAAKKDRESILPVCIKEESYLSGGGGESHARAKKRFVSERYRQLCALGAVPSIAQILSRNPAIDLVQVAADLTRADETPWIKNARAYVFGALKRGNRPALAGRTQEDCHAENTSRRSADERPTRRNQSSDGSQRPGRTDRSRDRAGTSRRGSGRGRGLDFADVGAYLN